MLLLILRHPEVLFSYYNFKTEKAIAHSGCSIVHSEYIEHILLTNSIFPYFIKCLIGGCFVKKYNILTQLHIAYYWI